MKCKFIVFLAFALALPISFSLFGFTGAQASSADGTSSVQETVECNTLDMQTPIWLIDKTAKDIQNEVALNSFADVSKYVGRELYYPTCGANDPQSFVSVIYSTKKVISPADLSVYKTHNAIQINIIGTIDHFWIDLDQTTDITFETNAIGYEKHGTIFKIREKDAFDAPYGNYHVSGNLEGCYYAFYADTVDEAKAVIDGLSKR